MGDVVGMDGAPVVETPPVDGIRAFDQDGREVIVPREEWRANVLPGMLQQVLSDPDQTYMLIVNSLRDGFLPEVMGAAEHLYRTDPIPARGASLWGAVLLQSGRLDEAQKVLEGYVATHGEEGSVLTNLAKVYDLQGNVPRSEATLWRVLEVDPNVDNAVGWYLSKAVEKEGEGAIIDALNRISELPKSWVARIGLATRALQAGEKDAALGLYREALQIADGLGLPAVPGQLLMQMSGDLGGTGNIPELVELTAPYFKPEMHGLAVGNNLIKAYCDLGRLDEAKAVVASLVALNHPEWRQPLAAWEQEIVRLSGGTVGPVPASELQIGMLRVDGPVWLPAGSPGWQIFGTKPATQIAVTFLGGTAEGRADSSPMHVDLMGRLSRALPLYFAEQVELKTAALGRAMLPWAVGKQSGFVIGSAAWSEEQAVAAVASSPGGVPTTYAVIVHIDASELPWTAELAFVRTADGVKIGELYGEFEPDALEDGLNGLAEEMVELVSAAAPGDGSITGRYTVPEGAAFWPYLQRLEQLLAVRCASMEVNGERPGPNFLTGEQQMLDSLIASCDASPGNVPLRLLMIEMMSAMHRVRPELVEANRAKVDALMTERPIA